MKKKAILMSIKPKQVAKILNGNKTIDIRKTAPKEWVDYLDGEGPKPEPCDVYIYCTQDKNNGLYWVNEYVCISQKGGIIPSCRNGKVVAKYTLREIDEILHDRWSETFFIEKDGDFRINVLPKTCINYDELKRYLYANEFSTGRYAYNISDLIIFDKPKELGDFVKPNGPHIGQHGYYRIKQAPQSWRHVEMIDEHIERKAMIDVTKIGYEIFYAYGFIKQKRFDDWTQRLSDMDSCLTYEQAAIKDAENAISQGRREAEAANIVDLYDEWVATEKAFFKHCIEASALDEEGKRLQDKRRKLSEEVKARSLIS